MKKRQPASSVFQNAKYFGKHVLIAGDNIYAVKSSKEASRLFEKLFAPFAYSWAA